MYMLNFHNRYLHFWFEQLCYLQDYSKQILVEEIIEDNIKKKTEKRHQRKHKKVTECPL